MNKIFVNSRFLTQKITGSQRFAIEISKQLKKLQPDRFIFVAPKNIIQKEIAKDLDAKIIGFNTGHIWEQLDLPLYLKKNGIPLLLNLVNTAPLLYNNKATVIHDISWHHFPKSVSKKFYYCYKFLIPKIINSSKYVFTVSHFSKNDIIKFANLKLKIDVVYNSVSKNFKKIDFSKDKIILSVSSLQPYKNLSSLIRAFIKLKNKYDFAEYKLVLIGGINNAVFSKTDIFKLTENRTDIIFTGYIDDESLVEYYNKSFLFVLPSFFEGFGIPPLEAMACGCPCVVSNAASLPEVCGDAAYYVNPYDVEDIARGIEKVLTDENLRQELIKKGFENVKRFSWEKSARKIIEILNQIG